MLINRIIHYYHTIKFLKPIQLYGQISCRLKRPIINLSLPPKTRHVCGQWVRGIFKKVELTGVNKLFFLNQEQDISSKHVWSDVTISKLWLYHLHYFDVLNIAPCSTLISWQHELIRRWINENPPPKGNGWEPYTLSLRIVNWIKWSYANNTISAEMLHSLAIQIRYLSKRLEIHLLGNHLLANAKALLFAGLFFEGQEANRWFKLGFTLFSREIKEQILADGGHFELSPMYHAIILEDLLDIMNLFNLYRQPVPAEWIHRCNKMFYWLKAMCHVDNEIAFFNDAAIGIAPTLFELSRYKNRLKLGRKSFKSSSLVYLAASGYCRIQHQGMILLTDLAEIGATYQPGHAHADTLSFELSIHRQRLIVNSGTSTYTEDNERLRQRGTKAHNTITINDRNSSEVWKSFRVAKRANIRSREVKKTDQRFLIRATHDGYYHQYKILHTRTWIKTDCHLSIIDELIGAGQYKITLAFHLHPDVQEEQVKENEVIFFDKKYKIIASLKTDDRIDIQTCTYHPSFNISLPNKKLIVESMQTLPIQFNTSISWSE